MVPSVPSWLVHCRQSRRNAHGRPTARSDPENFKHAKRGVALFTINRTAFVIQQLADPTVAQNIVERELIPQAGFTRVATNGYYSAYVRC